MNELLVIFAYTFLIAFIAVYFNKSMPYMTYHLNRILANIKPKKNNNRNIDCVLLEKRIQSLENMQGQPNRGMVEKMVVKIIKEKVDSGLLTYHKKQMIKEIVREEVIKYLTELKK
jgi:hypothetical protein